MMGWDEGQQCRVGPGGLQSSLIVACLCLGRQSAVSSSCPLFTSALLLLKYHPSHYLVPFCCCPLLLEIISVGGHVGISLFVKLSCQLSCWVISWEHGCWL